MKKVILAIAMFCALSIVAPYAAEAQNQNKDQKQNKTNQNKKTTAGVGQLVQGLVNVTVGDVNVQDITVQDLVNVNDVLNNNQIDVLRNSINKNEIASRNQNFLNNALREAKILTDNQTIVGVLSGGRYVVDGGTTTTSGSRE
ncbi:hypothetical protein [Telluribacter sp.]|jgi:hypothetical protein|uniref:hypothetical protein n=1 Tax=Telluribacter sp. TaxID=1978767 RepID=UPI002E0D1EED|nr:hypothetical protein [Telluribacter sp.]